MPRFDPISHSTHRAGKACALAVVMAFLATTTACSDLLTVENPDIVLPEDLDTPAGLQILRAGAFGDFAKAYGGDARQSDAREGQILASGLFTDEFKKTGTDPQRIAMDARQVDPTSTLLSQFYAAVQRARQAAESAAETFRNAEVPDGPAVVAEMTSLAGFTYTFLGETFCSGVPISGLTEVGDIEYGQPFTTTELFERAVERFQESAESAQSANRAELGYLARVGQARALLNLGRFSEAAAAVSGVPTDFRYDIRYSTTTRRQENAVHYANIQLERWSVVNRHGGVGLDYLDAFEAGDPRTPWMVAPDSVGFDQTAGTQYYQQLYPERDSPTPLATGIEARLIEAEAALESGNASRFETIHNELRASLQAGAVGPIAVDTMSLDERVDFHFRERGLWMWLTGHRLGDLRRLVRQYGRAQEDVFPSGPYFRPQFPTYGSDVNFPVPTTETNNPNFTQCINRDA